VAEIADRYDRNARLYERWWAPVLAPTAARLLDRCDAFALETLRGQGSLRVLDLGTGTGALAVDAAARWPSAEITGVDVARGMLSVAQRRAEAALGRAATDLRWKQADADRLPIDGGSIDLIVSSFVLQLVPDRHAALREVLRVLRPGGQLHFVTWIAGRDTFAPADQFDEAVYDLEIEEDDVDEEPIAGDYRSARTAERELREAGFRRVRAEREWLEQPWTLESYLGYKVEYDELGLFQDLDAETGARLRRRVHERLSVLDPGAFRWRVPIVFARAQRPG
jgi:ubiquinone/menaquinone biosynthesis C-methylase UbiE